MRRWRLSILLLSTVVSGCFLLPREEEVLAPPLMEAPTLAWFDAMDEFAELEEKA